MRLLLDTHIIVWAMGSPDRLDARLRRALADPTNELWVSPMSAWELAMLVERGRLRLLPDVAGWLQSASSALGLQEAALTSAVAQESWRIKMPTQDPADRFIAATARANGCTLVTADAALKRIPGQSVLFCRPRR